VGIKAGFVGMATHTLDISLATGWRKRSSVQFPGGR
jgi:hypothetical protein